MDDVPHLSHPIDWNPPMQSDGELRAALAESEAEAEADFVVSGEESMRDLRDHCADGGPSRGGGSRRGNAQFLARR